jgi:hypothetical protein
MDHNLYQAKQIGKTANENRYIILQDGPASFHVSVSRGNVTTYDHIENPPHMQFIEENIALLDTRIMEIYESARIDITA